MVTNVPKALQGLLETLREPEDPTLDIVAVHGLNGDPRDTWTHENTKKFWLDDNDFIKGNLAKARILTFGYNANVFEDVIEGRVATHGQDLLEDLRSLRGGVKNCPILFVAHSLGGIVTKRALIASRNHQEATYAQILKDTAGVIFLGTPHNGAELATKLIVAQKVASWAKLKHSKPGTTLTRELEPYSHTIIDINDEFSRGCVQELELVTFFEQKATWTPLGSQVIVPEGSAKGLYRGRIFGCDCTHEEICKFKSASDARFIRLQRCLDDIIRDSVKFQVSTKAMEGEEKELQERLLSLPSIPKVGLDIRNASTDLEVHHIGDFFRNQGFDLINKEKFMRALSGWEMHDGGATIDDEHPGTCQWILDHGSLRSWTSDPHPGIIFIFGPSGCGKSVLSKFLSRHFRDSEEGDVLTFFCRGVAGDCNASMVVEALLYQLLAIEPSLHTHVPVKYQDPDNLFSKDRSNDATKSTKLSYLWEIFTNILAHSKLKKLFAFIDGLDECEASSREKLLFLLRRTLSQRLARGFQETTNVKICITCRPFGNVHESMHHNIHLRHHSDGTKSNAKRMDDDIKQLVQSELSEIGHAYTPQLRQYAEDMILARAQGMFLWVSCILDRLRHAESTPETVENILHSFPSNMNGYYSGVLDQLSLTDANGMARRILSMILMAVTPLRHDQLAEALAIRPECTSTADLRKFKNMDIVNWVHSNCSQLIKSNGSTFELVHYSLAEYLNQNIDKIVATFGYDIPNAQLSMAQLCIRYMNFEDFRSRLQHFESEEAVFEAYPFYKYASTYWPIHLRLCGDVVTQGMETFSQFLDPDLNSSNYKTWCSVMQWYTPYRVPWDGLPLLHVFAHYGCINAARAMVLLQKPFRGDSFFVRMKKAGSFGMRVFAVALGTPCFGISVDVDELASFGKTALTCACETNEWEMVYLILEHGAHPDGTPSDLTTPLSAAARRGHTDVVNLLLLAGATIDLPSRNPMGNDPELTPLHWACVNGHVAVVQLLLASGAKRDSLTSARDTPLLLAIENNHIQIAEMLVHQGVDLSLSELSGTSPLISAARRGSLELVRLLLRKGARPNVQQHSDGITALHWAVSNEHEAIVVELLLYNADPMIRSKNGTSLLHLAAHRSHAAVVQSLLGAKADPNEIDGGGCGPIHYAAGLGHKDVVQTLLDGQANIGLTDTSGVTPLNWASMRGHRDVVMLLLHRGADVTIKAANGLTPLKSAAQSGYLEIVHLLIAAVKDLGALDIISSSLTNASMMGHIAVVQALIDSGADINYLGTGHYTALSGASSYGRVDIIKLLLSKSASLECGKGPLGCTPLGHAVQNGHAAAVLALLSAGAQKTTVFADGTTLLHMAAVRGCVEILDILLAPEVQEPLPIDQESGHHDIDKAVSPSVDGCSLPASLLQMIDRRNDTGETALTLACGKGHCVIAERLIAAGAHVGFRYPNHNTLLHHVTGLGHHDLIRLLISKTNHIDDSANNTHHPLHIACNNSGYEAAKILLDAGAQPSVDCGIAGSPLHQAALKGDTKMISLLLDHGAVVDQPQIDGSTPLHLATRLKHEEAILRLLSAGANPALRDPWTGSTLYHESAYNGNTKLIQACFDAGLPVDARDELDRTPLMKAIAGGHMAIMQNLIAGGSDFQLKDSFGLSAYDYAISRYVFDDQSMTVLWDEDIHAKSSPTKCFRFGLRLTQIASTAVRLSQSMQREHPPRYYFIADINRCVILLGKTELCNSGLLIYTTGQLTAPLMREMLCRSCRVLLNVRGVRYMCQRCPDMMFCATCFAKYQSIGGHGAYCRGHTFIKCKRSRGPLQQGQEPSDDEDWSDTAAINADWTEARMKDWLREVETFALESAAILGPIIQASLVRHLSALGETVASFGGVQISLLLLEGDAKWTLDSYSWRGKGVYFGETGEETDWYGSLYGMAS